MSGGFDPADDFAVLTLSEYVSGIRDQRFNDFALLSFLEGAGIIDRRSGGDGMVVPINTGRNTNGGSYSGADVFTHAQANTLANAYFNFAKYQWSIEAYADDILRNMSREKIADLWMNKADMAMKSLRERLNTDLFADGTGNGGKNLDGLGIAIDSAGTYGLVDRSTTTQWAAQETAVGGAIVIDTPVGLNRFINDCGIGSSTPGLDVFMTTQAIVEQFESKLSPAIRIQPSNIGDVGFRGGVAHKGIPFAWDHAAPTGTLFGIKKDTMKIVIHPDRDFRTTKIRRPEDGTADQDVYLAYILLMIQLINMEPRRNGKLTGIA